jgi:uncharacterized membrane protein
VLSTRSSAVRVDEGFDDIECAVLRSVLSVEEEQHLRDALSDR